jgi:hypothetical protein
MFRREVNAIARDPEDWLAVEQVMEEENHVEQVMEEENHSLLQVEV